MRVSPAIRVKGRIAREVSGSANPNDRLARIARAGRQHACTFDTLMARIPQKWVTVLRKECA
jgi:hypothetical protein